MPPRKKAEHGTRSGYNAHLRDGTTPCAKCKKANSEHVKEVKEGNKAMSANDFQNALAVEPDVEENLDQLQELREALKAVRAAQRVSSPMHQAGLAKQRAALASEIKELEDAQTETKEVDPLEELLKL